MKHEPNNSLLSKECGCKTLICKALHFNIKIIEGKTVFGLSKKKKQPTTTNQRTNEKYCLEKEWGFTSLFMSAVAVS